jgi:hypothetical protein
MDLIGMTEVMPFYKTAFEGVFHQAEPSEKVDTYLAPDDNIFLECAQVANVHYE